MVTALLAQEEEVAETSNFLIPNATFFVMLLIFLVVFLVIRAFVVPPISKVLREREQLLEKTAEDNHQAARELGNAQSAYTEELAGARAEAAAIREEGRAEGQAVLDEMRGRAREESERISAQAADELRAQGEQVSAQLRERVGPLADTLARRVLGSDTADRAGRG
ncbi:MAG TPA: F0F1 ATP synthase subunit B [Aldersonia sp.]